VGLSVIRLGKAGQVKGIKFRSSMGVSGKKCTPRRILLSNEGATAEKPPETNQTLGI
jgi:hypothetical protein